MSLSSYLLGAAGLAAFGLALLYAALRVRGWLLPGWEGAPARLAEAVVWLALVVWVSQLLGVAGLFEPLPLLAGGAATGIVVGVLAARGRSQTSRQPPELPPAPRPDTLAVVAAALAVAAVVAAWAVPTAQSFAAGIDGADSTWYHLSQAARFAQTGSVGELHFTDPYFLNWFYPQNTELLHGLGMVAFDSDLLSPLVNLPFLVLGLLAAWCVGRPWGLGPATLIGAALVFAAEMTIDFQAGEARNDAVGLALFLASVALVVNARTSGPATTTATPIAWSRGIGLRALGIAGLAAGLAAGTKLSLLAPVAALTVGVVLIAAGGSRWRVAVVWTASLLAGCGFWFVRNLVHAGNPLPWVDSVGPISLQAPERAIELRPEFSVVHYIADGDIWADWFLPGLGDGIGPLWPALLTLAAIAAGLALLAGGRGLRRERVATRPFEGAAARAFGSAGPGRPRGTRALLAMLGGVVVASAIAYLVTPLTASGEEGAPVGFVWNLRYLGPALALGLTLLPLVPPLRQRPWRWLTLALLFSILIVQIALLDVWSIDEHAGWALGAALLTLAAFVAGAWLMRRQEGPRPLPRAALAAAALVGAAAILVAGQVLQRDYDERRYARSFAFFDLDNAVAWANDLSGARIATAGRGGVFFQYGFYGDELSNHVQWVGLPGPHGAWLPAESCPEWRQAVNDGDYDYVVTTFDGPNPLSDTTSREREWVQGDPAAEEVLADDPVAVYRLNAPLDPSAC